MNYTSRSAFKKAESGAYLAAIKGSFLNDICKHMTRPIGRSRSWKLSGNSGSTITLTCCYCGVNVERRWSEYERTKDRDGRIFCSKTCQGRQRKEESFFNGLRIQSKKNAANRGIHYLLTNEILENVWNRQNGKCVYSGVDLDIHSKSNNYKPSIDRICSNIGYIESNIQFVSLTMNYMKHRMTHEEMIEIITILKGK